MPSLLSFRRGLPENEAKTEETRIWMEKNKFLVTLFEPWAFGHEIHVAWTFIALASAISLAVMEVLLL